MSHRQELLTVILICFFGTVLWYCYYNSYEKLYTIGNISSKQTGLKSGTIAKFTYFFEGRMYEGGTGIGDYEVKIGDRYIVEFAKDEVKISEALFYYPIPDSVNVKPPLKGWESTPRELKKFRRKRMELFGLFDLIFKE